MFVPVAGLAAVVPNPVPPNRDGAVDAGVVPNPPNGVAVKYNHKLKLRHWEHCLVMNISESCITQAQSSKLMLIHMQ